MDSGTGIRMLSSGVLPQTTSSSTLTGEKRKLERMASAPSGSCSKPVPALRVSAGWWWGTHSVNYLKGGQKSFSSILSLTDIALKSEYCE